MAAERDTKPLGGEMNLLAPLITWSLLGCKGQNDAVFRKEFGHRYLQWLGVVVIAMPLMGLFFCDKPNTMKGSPLFLYAMMAINLGLISQANQEATKALKEGAGRDPHSDGVSKLTRNLTEKSQKNAQALEPFLFITGGFLIAGMVNAPLGGYFVIVGIGTIICNGIKNDTIRARRDAVLSAYRQHETALQPLRDLR